MSCSLTLDDPIPVAPPVTDDERAAMSKPIKPSERNERIREEKDIGEDRRGGAMRGARECGVMRCIRTVCGD